MQREAEFSSILSLSVEFNRPPVICAACPAKQDSFSSKKWHTAKDATSSKWWWCAALQELVTCVYDPARNGCIYIFTICLHNGNDAADSDRQEYSWFCCDSSGGHIDPPSQLKTRGSLIKVINNIFACAYLVVI